jgi:hypothetical protein
MASLRKKKRIGSAKDGSRSEPSGEDCGVRGDARQIGTCARRGVTRSEMLRPRLTHGAAIAQAFLKCNWRRGVKETASWKRETVRFCVGDQDEISINLVDEGLSFVATRPGEFTLRWAGILAFGAWVRAMIPDEE